MNLKGCFRPLSGSYISQYSFAFLFLYQFLTVSVPYRGATFLNLVSLFPYHILLWFPSPIGELHFSIFSTKYGLTYFAVVSVPYRGATFLNIVLHILDKEGTTFPSPIGELHFSMKCLNRFSQMTKFPSPIGELHFSMNQSSL